MQVWYIITAILVLLIGIALLRIRVRFIYEDQRLAVYLCVLCFRFSLYSNRKRVNTKRYTYRRYRKRLLAQRKKEQQRATQAVSGEKPKKARKKTLRESMRLYSYLVKKLYLRFLHHFRIDVTRLHITVATGDAAQTAIAYGVVAQAAAYVFEVLQNHSNFHHAYRADCAVIPDFVGDKSYASCNITFSLRVFEIVDLGIRFFYHFLIGRMRRQTSDSNKEKKTWQKAN